MEYFIQLALPIVWECISPACFHSRAFVKRKEQATCNVTKQNLIDYFSSLITIQSTPDWNPFIMMIVNDDNDDNKWWLIMMVNQSNHTPILDSSGW